MKIKFIGVGSAFTTPRYYQSNLLVFSRSGKKLLLDCGTDIRFSLSEYDISFRDPGSAIDAVYISHLHSDHIGGMEWFAIETYFGANPQKPRLFMEQKIMREMWENSLKGGLGCIEGKCMHLTDYFDCRPVGEGETFIWEGIQFTLVKMLHIKTGYKNFYSHGVLIKDMTDDGPMVFFTTDTQFQPGLIASVGEKADIIFHDCETTPFKSMVHAHYTDLASLPLIIKRKMWLYHYQPDPEFQPEKDGFIGFVTKGQEFDFAGETKEQVLAPSFGKQIPHSGE